MNKIDDFQGIYGLDVVMLFGSTARKDDDYNSDIDIFVLVNDNLSELEKEHVINNVINLISKKNINVSLYTKEIFTKMLKDGSMFLWHLNLEGKYIFNRSEENIFKDLNEFRAYEKNFNLYQDLFNEVKTSLLNNSINSYDLSMLFFICRNLCLLTCFKLGTPNFGRYSAYKNLIVNIGYEPLNWDSYTYLSKWRIDYTRGIDEELQYPQWNELSILLSGVEELFRCSKNIICSEGME